MRQFLSTLVLIFIVSAGFSQKVEYYKDQGLWKKVKAKKAKFSRVISQYGDTVVMQSYRLSDEQLLFERKWIDQNPVGKWKKYDLEGNILSVDDYDALVYRVDDDSLIRDPEGMGYNDFEYAEFPGGQDSLVRYMAMKIRYPALARDMNLTGTVILELSIDEDGYPKPERILKSAHPYLDMECWNLVSSMPKWTPATNEGKYVFSYYKLPFRFNLK